MTGNAVQAENSEDIAGLQVCHDELGAFVVLVVDTAVFDRTVVMKTAYWYTDSYYVFIARGDNLGSLKIELRTKAQARPDSLELLAREFRNRLLDQQVRQMVAEEAGGIRDALIKKAFFEGNRRIEATILRSDEGAIPSSDESYRDDPLEITKGQNA